MTNVYYDVKAKLLMSSQVAKANKCVLFLCCFWGEVFSLPANALSCELRAFLLSAFLSTVAP